MHFFEKAADCFETLVKEYDNLDLNPERAQLYIGLTLLAKGMVDLEHQLKGVRGENYDGVNAVLKAIDEK